MAVLSTPIDVEASWATFDDESGYTQYHERIAVWKSTNDLDRYRQALAACAPEVVVETGTRWGGSALWFADQGVDVITVDVSEKPTIAARSTAPRHLAERITWLFGDSTDPQVIARVAKHVGGRRCMVSLDSEHAAPHVAAEIDGYGPLVSPGCYLVVEDGLADLVDAKRAVRLGRRIPDEGGPLAAVESRLAGNPDWRRDEELEALTAVSHSPGGWWVRCG